MRLKTITFIGILFLTLHSYAQQTSHYEGIYIGVGYEAGLLFVGLNDTDMPFENSEINNSLKHSISFSIAYKTASGLDFELGYLPSQNTMVLEGKTLGKNFKIRNNYFSHTALAGIGYNIPLSRIIDIRIGIGASMTFVGDENILREKIGEDGTKIVVENNTVKNNNIHLVFPISVIKYYSNGNYLTLGAKYYHSFSKSFIEGSVKIPNRELKYSTLNNAIALHLNYFFRIQTEKDDCGCLF